MEPTVQQTGPSLKLVFKLSKTQNKVEVEKREPLIIKLPRQLVQAEVRRLEELERQQQLERYRRAFDTSSAEDDSADDYSTSRRKRKMSETTSDAEFPPAKRYKEEEVAPKSYAPLKKVLNSLLKHLIKEDEYGFFYEPVREEDAPNYSDYVKKPMDFLTMREKLNRGRYPYLNLFQADFELICNNAMTYNDPSTVYYKEAKRLLGKGVKMIRDARNKIAPEHWEGPPPPDDGTDEIIAREVAATVAAAHASSNGVSTRAVTATREFEASRPKPIEIKWPKREYVDISTVPPPQPLVKHPPGATPSHISAGVAKPHTYQTYQTPTTTKFGPGSRAFVSPSATPTTPSAPKTKTPTLPAQNYINNTRQAPSTPSGWISEHLPEEYEKRTIASRDAFTSGITLDSYQRRLEDYVRDMPEYIRERVRQIIEEIKSGIPAPKQPLSRTIACT